MVVTSSEVSPVVVEEDEDEVDGPSVESDVVSVVVLL